MSLNTLYIDVKYAGLLSNKLSQFRVKKANPYLANFRCPICGDSERSKFKARGYLFFHKGTMMMKCWNCGISYSFGNFIKRIDPLLFDEYSREVYKEQFTNIEKSPVKFDIIPPKYLGTPLAQLKKISQLPYDHYAKQYILNRKIENFWHSKLFFCPAFAAWTNLMIPDKLPTTNDEPRLIIPLCDQSGKMFGYQGRSFKKKTTLRYITIMLEERPKVFGLDTINKKERVYLTEGPIDSMFLANGAAMVGADVNPTELFNDFVMIYDNEPRNKNIVQRVDSCIEKGYNVCIWDDTFKGKDINEMILNGADDQHIKIVINKRTFTGLQAKLELLKWKKI